MQNVIAKKSFRYAESLILLIFWVIIFLSPVVLVENMTWNKVWHDWQRLLPYLFLVFINHFVLVPYLFFKKNKIWYFLSMGLLLTVLVVFMPQLQHVFDGDKSQPQNEKRGDFPVPPHGLPMFEPGNRPFPGPENQGVTQANPMGLPPRVNLFLIALFILGFDTGLRTFFKWSKSERERESLEKERVKSELAFLRNQISPHFFMNTLNNIHALIDINGEEAKDSIIRLSKLMRHLLYESDDEEVLLSMEVDFMKNYIDLMKLRFTERVKVSSVFPDVIPEITIPPMLFTSLIENAFKHGISYNAHSFIHVIMKIENSCLNFKIQNTNFSSGIKSKASGIGLANIRKRLDLLYHDQYTLEINNQSDIFAVSLSIPL